MAHHLGAPACFLTPTSLLRPSLFTSSPSPSPSTSNSRPRRRARLSPRMAKIQPGQDVPSPTGDDVEGTSDVRPASKERISIPPARAPIPGGVLPTLSSLRDGPTEPVEEAEKVEEVVMMGTGISAAGEESIVDFLKDVYAEFQIIDWPSVSRVVKITLIVIATMIIASVGIYTVDGFFLSLSQKVFDR